MKMRAPFDKSASFLSALALLSLPLALPVAANANDREDSSAGYSDHDDHHSSHRVSSELLDKVHDALTRYEDINQALKREKGWVVATPCVSGPETGAMGIHIVKPSRLADGYIKAEEPEALIYEPQRDGSMRLVGVEYIQDYADWLVRNPNGPPPDLDGNLMNFVGFPNRYGLNAFYELHVWAFEHNPKGSFADFNTHVTCEKQPDVK